MSGIDSFTKLMLHGDGTNGSTTFTDSSASVHTQTAHGSCAISTAQSKFGGAAIKCATSTSDWLAASSSSDFDFGSGDFTIDYWVYQLSHANPVVHVAREQTTTFPPFLIGYGGSQVYMSSTGSSWDVASGKTLGAEVINGWSHLALVRSGTTFYTFRDGVQQDTWTSSATLPTKTGAMGIGSGQSGNYMNGYIDELRVSKGIARYTANFTPETSAYSVAGFTYVAPPTISASPTAQGLVVASAVLTTSSTPYPYIVLIDPTGSPCRHYQLEYYNVVSDREIPPTSLSGALLTVRLSMDGGVTTFSGPNYNNTGIDAFAGESNSTFAAPYSFGTPQTLDLGFRLSIDTGDLPAYGVSGFADIMNAGQHTQYICRGVKGGDGGLASDIRPSGTKPTASVGQKWFPADGSQYFHWAVPFFYAGHFDGDLGVAPNAFIFTMDGGTMTGVNIAAGTFILRRMD